MTALRGALVVAGLVVVTTCRGIVPSGPPGAAVYQQVADSAVVLLTNRGSGSGTVVATLPASALVLTAHHVVAGASAVRVSTAAPDGFEAGGASEVAARVVAADRLRDLALVETAAPLERAAMPIAAEEPALYEELVVLGAPMGLQGTAAPAILSSKWQRLGGADVWEITGLVFFGSSGGTVANARGELVAVPIVVATWRGLPIPQIGFCVPLGSIHAFLERALARRLDSEEK